MDTIEKKLRDVALNEQQPIENEDYHIFGSHHLVSESPTLIANGDQTLEIKKRNFVDNPELLELLNQKRGKEIEITSRSLGTRVIGRWHGHDMEYFELIDAPEAELGHTFSTVESDWLSLEDKKEFLEKLCEKSYEELNIKPASSSDTAIAAKVEKLKESF